MGLEIERKFLVNKDLWTLVNKIDQEQIRQGYLMNESEMTIRIRTTNAKGYITIKGKTIGISRAEFEYEIPKQDARQLLDAFCDTGVIKIRTKIKYMDKTWEVDEFAGENEGLIVAELELDDVSETFGLPPWIEREVSEESKYYNNNLANHPYKNWLKEM